MDVVLKELFGGSSGQEDDFIAKSLFERQDQEQLGRSSQQVDNERSELLSSLPGLSLSPSSGADLGSVPEKMPMYLLEDDEGNDEEIIRLLDPPAPPPQPVASPAVPIVLPWTGMGVNITPIQVIPNSPPKRKRHGGGWPKGKSRKSGIMPPPKPPSSGYGQFLSEHMAGQKVKSSESMSQVSKQLGRKWSALSVKEKEAYYQKSAAERSRYLTELRQYLLATSGLTGEDVDKLLSQTLATENNDSLLLCELCKLTFTSLHNKRSHYTGRQHTQTLLDAFRPRPAAKQDETMISVVASEAVKFNVCLNQVKEGLREYKSHLQANACLAQSAAEQEFLYSQCESELTSLGEQWTTLWEQLQTLMSFCYIKHVDD